MVEPKASNATPARRPSARRPIPPASVPSSSTNETASVAADEIPVAPLPSSGSAKGRVGARRNGGPAKPGVPTPKRVSSTASVASDSPKLKRKRATPEQHPAKTSRKVSELPSVGAESMTGSPPSQPSVQQQLQEIEQRLDALLDDVHHGNTHAAARKRAAEAIGNIAARLDAEPGLEAFEGTTLLSTAREMLSTDYYLRQWGRLGMRNRSEQVDDFGLDPTYEARVRPLFELLYDSYFRVEAEGLEHIPADGRVMLIGNHSGTIPLDGVMLKTAIGRHHAAKREMRWLAEDFVFHFPFLGAFMNRIGAVRACQENAERLLAQGNVLAVFPEGIQGIGKLYRDRYRLQRFGRGGYIRLALRTGTPIVPVAIVGGEETYPLLLKLTKLAKPLGVPFVPVTPLFPLLGPLGLLPLPSRWRIVVGPPIAEVSEYGPDDAGDPIIVNRLNERVRGAIQEMLGAALLLRGEHAFVARV